MNTTNINSNPIVAGCVWNEQYSYSIVQVYTTIQHIKVHTCFDWLTAQVKTKFHLSQQSIYECV